MLSRPFKYLTQFDRNLWFLSIGWFVGAMGFAVSIPFISIYFYQELGLTMSQIGLFFGGMAIVRALFQVIGGEISDRMPRRYLLVHTQIIRSFAFVLIAASIYYKLGFWAIGGSLLLNSIFGAMFHPAANAMVSDILPKNKRLDGYAITRSAGNLGWAVGPALGGFMANYSYSFLFILSAVITFSSGMVFWIFMTSPVRSYITDKFKLSDLKSIKDDPFLARHSILIFILYLVVAQLIAPFSVYAVDMIKISESHLGTLYTINGLMVVLLQVPVTSFLSRYKFTTQLIWGSFIYVVGYSLVGFLPGFEFFIFSLMIVTFGEIFMSPPSLALTARLAPDERMGRYMGIFSFFVAAGWSFGPMFGGIVLDHLGHTPALAWMVISSMGIVSGVGYIFFARKLPDRLNYKE